MTEQASLRAVVSGLVQGVFFRDFTSRRARELGLSGYVRNLPDGSVEVRVEGPKEKLQNLVDYLKTGPPDAKVEKVATEWSEFTGHYSGFRIKY